VPIVARISLRESSWTTPNRTTNGSTGQPKVSPRRGAGRKTEAEKQKKAAVKTGDYHIQNYLQQQAERQQASKPRPHPNSGLLQRSANSNLVRLMLHS
jgi:hypothetical protein